MAPDPHVLRGVLDDFLGCIITTWQHQPPRESVGEGGGGPCRASLVVLTLAESSAVLAVPPDTPPGWVTQKFPANSPPKSVWLPLLVPAGTGAAHFLSVYVKVYVEEDDDGCYTSMVVRVTKYCEEDDAEEDGSIPTRTCDAVGHLVAAVLPEVTLEPEDIIYVVVCHRKVWPASVTSPLPALVSPAVHGVATALYYLLQGDPDDDGVASPAALKFAWEHVPEFMQFMGIAVARRRCSMNVINAAASDHQLDDDTTPLLPFSAAFIDPVSSLFRQQFSSGGHGADRLAATTHEGVRVWFWGVQAQTAGTHRAE